MELLNEILRILIDQWKFDIDTLSNPWMYVPLLIPVMFYVPFMMFKWMLITCPIWIPFSLIAGIIASLRKS